MLAYTNTVLDKPTVLARVRAHRLADTLIFGKGWCGVRDSGAGCAVGCTLHTYDHTKYPAVIGVPVELAHLEDAIFDGFGRTDQKELGLAWPERFLDAIPVGADLSMVWPRWALWMLRGLNDRGNAQVRSAIDGVIAPYDEWAGTGTKPARDRWIVARKAAARAAARAATYAAANAAYAAYATATTAAACAACAAANSAYARSKFWCDASDELVRLLASAPVPASV